MTVWKGILIMFGAASLVETVDNGQCICTCPQNRVETVPCVKEHAQTTTVSTAHTQTVSHVPAHAQTSPEVTERAPTPSEMMVTESSASPIDADGNFTFGLVGGHYSHLPSKPFSGVSKVTNFRLEIMNVTLDNLFDPADDQSPFERITFDGKAVIHFDRTTVHGEWKWTRLSRLSSVNGAMASIEIYRSSLTHLPSEFATIAGGAVGDVMISTTPLKTLGDKVFKAFRQVSRIILINNKIDSIKRSQFPNPATSLSHLVLAANRIRSLPDDIFLGMPALELVSLYDNPLYTLNEATFLPLMNRRTKVIQIEDLPLYCDCRLRWMKKPTVDKELLKGATCKYPYHLRFKEILTDLTASDLVCEDSDTGAAVQTS